MCQNLGPGPSVRPHRKPRPPIVSVAGPYPADAPPLAWAHRPPHWRPPSFSSELAWEGGGEGERRPGRCGGPAPTLRPPHRGKRKNDNRKSIPHFFRRSRTRGPNFEAGPLPVMDEAAATRCACSSSRKRSCGRRRDDEGWLNVWRGGDEEISSKRRRNNRYNGSGGDAVVPTGRGRRTQCSWSRVFGIVRDV